MFDSVTHKRAVASGRQILSVLAVVAMMGLGHLPHTVLAQSQLPAAVRADILMVEIVETVQAGENARALELLSRYRALEREGHETPPRILFFEARVASETGDPQRALAALNAYLAKVDRDDEDYSEAVRMYAGLQRRAEEQLRRMLPDVLRQIEGGMVDIPGGSFVMGSAQGQGQDRERPARTVQVRPFRLARFPVTLEQFRLFILLGGHDIGGCSGDRNWEHPGFDQGPDHPVVCVNHGDAEAFVRWLNAETGGGYRLPTEAEWEYAARAGTTTAYPWGDSMQPRRANCRESDCQDGFANTSPVGSFPANAFGLFDMHGNVWEWVQDCWNSNYQGAPNDGSAWLTGDCSRRVLRGGSWLGGADWLRSSYRYWNPAGGRGDNFGFRLAQD